MSGIRPAIQDILTKLSAVAVTNADGYATTLYSRLWNNQLRDLEGDKGYAWPMPAAFVEVVSPVSYDILGLGFRSADIGIKIHLIHEFLNQDGTFEQDLTIFDLRDQIIKGLSQYCPTACGALNCISESNDSDHDNLVHYVMEFVCNFIDSKGSPLEDMNEDIIPDLDLRVDASEAQTETQDTSYFIIPNKQR